MKIGIIGSGISGLVAAYLLDKKHEVWLFEQENYLGGHSHTVEIYDKFGCHNIDTGFIVCNKSTYPNFMNLLSDLNVDLEKSRMSFSVKDASSNIEYAGTNFNTIFAQRKNLYNLNFIRMLVNINQFNKRAKQKVSLLSNQTLGEFLAASAISDWAIKYYVLPLVSAIWSTSTEQALEFPASLLFKFLDNHGLLELNGAPQWYTIKGGSISYVEKLRKLLKGRILLQNKVHSVKRLSGKIHLKTNCVDENFDKLIFAVHSDQVLDILKDPTDVELATFNNIKYQSSVATLHTDISVLPRSKRAWASWNYFINNSKQPNLTYNMNILQNLKTDVTYCVSLNLDKFLDKQSIIASYNYSHPVYNLEAMEAKKSWHQLNKNDIYYAGAYWGYGFHEDGVNSAIRVVNAIDEDILCNKPYIQVL